MGKTAAEKQRAYRERKKLKDPEFLQHEKARVMAYYTPASQMPAKQLKARNLKSKIRNRVSRLKQSKQQGTSDQPPLIVRLPAIETISGSKNKKEKSKKATGITTTRKRALARAHKKIKNLKSEVAVLNKRLKTRSKQLERLHKRSKISTPTRLSKELTGLSPKRKASVKKQLLLGNAIIEEIKATKETTTLKGRHQLHSTLAGKITKKYRLMTSLSKKTGFSRNSLRRCNFKSIKSRTEQRASLTKDLQDSIQSFMSREDNSRVQPGKSDAKKNQEGEKIQTIVLTDYLQNLHLKYLAENPNVKISLASFCRLRPKHILLAAFISRNACQCTRHQNMALKINALRKAGCELNQNPDKLQEAVENLDNILSQAPDPVVYKTWKRMLVKEGDKEFHKMRIVEESKDKATFIESFKKDSDDFVQHVKRVQVQYQQLRQLKQELRDDEVIVQMDFAENYSCRSLDEIQTAYWNQTSVTLHPMVVYYKEEGALKHKSIVAVSDELGHSAGTVCAFIEELIPEILKVKPNANKVHYWTDSPTSQYRNRYIFKLTAKHHQKYHMKAQWNYFEAGHGKGPCDGLGGTTKRMADEAIRQGKTIIQDARDFYRWAITSTMQGVNFIFVDKDMCQEQREEIQKDPIKPVKDSLKIHAVIGISQEEILTRHTSCYCEDCLRGDFCRGWLSVKLQCAQAKKKQRDAAQEIEPEPEVTEKSKENTEEPEENADIFEACEEKKYVACRYQEDWYIGQIEEVDKEDKEIKVNFMEKTKNTYRWPNRADRLWVEAADILCFINEPTPTGKSRRNFNIAAEDMAIITTLFK